MQRWHAAVACCAHATARSSSPEACWAEARRRAQAAAQGLPRVGAALPAGAAGELLRVFHSLAADAVASVRAAAAASLPALAALLPPSVRGALGGAAAALARDAARPVAAAAAAALGPFLAELAPEDVSDGTLLSAAAHCIRRLGKPQCDRLAAAGHAVQCESSCALLRTPQRSQHVLVGIKRF